MSLYILQSKFLSSNNSTLFQFAFAWCSGAIAMAAVGKYPTSVQFLSTGSSPAPSTSAVTPNIQVPPPPSPKPAAEPLAVGAPPCTQTVLDALNSNPQLSKTASIAIASGTLWTNCHVIAYHCIFACPGGSKTIYICLLSGISSVISNASAAITFIAPTNNAWATTVPATVNLNDRSTLQRIVLYLVAEGPASVCDFLEHVQLKQSSLFIDLTSQSHVNGYIAGFFR